MGPSEPRGRQVDCLEVGFRRFQRVGRLVIIRHDRSASFVRPFNVTVMILGNMYVNLRRMKVFSSMSKNINASLRRMIVVTIRTNGRVFTWLLPRLIRRCNFLAFDR